MDLSAVKSSSKYLELAQVKQWQCTEQYLTIVTEMKFPSPEDTIIVMTVSNGGRRVTRGEYYSDFQPDVMEKNISIPCNVMDESNCIGNLFSYSREVEKYEGNYTVGSNGNNGCVNSV